MIRASTFCPAGISSFFHAMIHSKQPGTIEEACHVGATGGGFVIAEGVDTELFISPAKTNNVEVQINERITPDAKVTREVCNLLLPCVEGSFDIVVKHEVGVPIGAGYGASAAGAVSTAMALCKALDLKMTLNQMAQYAHFAELRCATGLGSVSGVIRGGAILIMEAGAPGFDRVDWLPLEPSQRIVTASFAPISKENIIFSPTTLEVVNREAQTVMMQILSNPNPILFLELCHQFARKAGFLTDRLSQILVKVLKAGALGATQNMIGDAFHALVYKEDVDTVVEAITQDFPPGAILVTEINYGGPRYK